MIMHHGRKALIILPLCSSHDESLLPFPYLAHLYCIRLTYNQQPHDKLQSQWQYFR